MRQARDNKIGRQPVRLPPEKELFAYEVLDFPVLPMIMSISSTPTPRTMPMIDVMTSGVINRMAAAKVTARSHQLMSRLKKPDTVIADVLRTIKLAEGYTDKMAVVGFPGVTSSAHTLCNLLRLKIPIETVRSSEELPEVLNRLRKMQIGTVICDAVTHRTAKSTGFQALLITSGEQSLQQAIQGALIQGRKFRALRNENTLLRSMLQQSLEQCVVLDANKDVVFASEGRQSDELVAAMRRRISAIPRNRELLFYHQEGAILHTVTASRFYLRERQLYLFRDQPA